MDVDPNLERASFGTLDKVAVVAFLKSLTDERVRNQSAPFDHPSLQIPNGGVVSNGVLTEQMITIPATGAGGGARWPGSVIRWPERLLNSASEKGCKTCNWLIHSKEAAKKGGLFFFAPSRTIFVLPSKISALLSIAIKTVCPLSFAIKVFSVNVDRRGGGAGIYACAIS